MARRKLTEADQSTEGLPRLTDKQMRFVQAKAGGASNADAVRQATDTAGWSNNAVWVEGAKLSNNPKVRLWLASAQEDGRIEAGLTRGRLIKRLVELSERAEQSGNYGAAVQAADKAGEYAGHKVHLSADVTDHPDIVAWLDKRAKDVEHDPDALQQLKRIAQRYEVDWTPQSERVH